MRVNQELSFTHFKQFGKYCGFRNWDLNILNMRKENQKEINLCALFIV